MVDPLLVRARQAAASQAGVRRSPVFQLQQQLERQMAAADAPKAGSLAELKAQAKSLGEANKQSSGGGGLLGRVLGSTPVKVASKPLSVLGMPQRAVVAAVDDFFDLMSAGNTGDNLDFWDNVKDPNYGVGQYVDTGNKWADRALGFGGDVITDPLTYLTAGVGRFAGSSGRLAAATKLAEAGADAATVQKAARLGVTALDDVARQQLGLGEHGIRFMGQRVAGTGGISRGVGESLSRARAAIGDTGFGTWYRGKRSPEKIARDIEVLTGRQAGNPIVSAARVFADDQIRMGEKTFANSFTKDMERWDGLSTEARRDVTHAIERGDTVEGAEFFDALFEALGEYGATGVKKRENYVLHAATKEYLDWAKANPDHDIARRLLVDDGDTVGRALERKFEPGKTYRYGDQQVTLETASIKEINDKIGGMLGFKVMEDDIAKIARLAVVTSAKDAALASAIRSLKERFPQLARLEKDMMTKDVIDKAATRKLKTKEVKRLGRLARELRGEATAARRGATKKTLRAKEEMLKVLRRQVQRAESISDDLARQADDAVRALDGTAAGLESARQGTEAVVAGIDAELAVLRQELADLGVAAGVDPLTADAVRAAGVERRVARRRTRAELEKAIREHEEAKAFLDELVNGFGGGRGDLGTRQMLVGKTGARVGDLEAELEALSGRLPVYAQGDEMRAGVRGAVADTEASVAEREAARQAALDDLGADEVLRGAAIAASQGWVDATGEALSSSLDALAVKRSARDTVKGVRASGNAAERQFARDEMERVLPVLMADDSAEASVIRGLLADANRMVGDAANIEFSASSVRAMRKRIKDGEFQPVMVKALADGWERIGKNLLGDEDATVLVTELRDHFRRYTEIINDPDWVKLLDKYTTFFKTYATMSPGFHFRNGMSASFMNFTEGVGVGTQLEAFSLFKRLRDDPRKFMNTASPDEVAAVRAMYGSGAGGNFDVSELGEMDAWGRLSNNKATRLSRRLGEWVEGPARLALAMDTIGKGGSVEEALARITRVQFDYSQMSQFDRKMKRLIPFWTFMSRNLPLQLQQMWLKPRAYAVYDHFVDNFDADGGGERIIPLNWVERGAFNTGFKFPFTDDPMYLAPDLPHIQVQEELEKLTDPKRFLAQANPPLRVLAELMFNEKLYSGREFYDDENKWLYALTNTVPAAAQLDRLSGGGVTNAFGQSSQYRKERQGQSIASYLGLPALQLSDGALEAELRRRAREGG